MACDLFKPRLAALVYDDISPEDRAAVQAHLAACPACSAALERLAGTRAILADAAPESPRAPGLMVLAPRRAIPAWASFAAGVAAAALVGTAGFLAGTSSRPPATTAAPAATVATVASLDAEQARAIAREETRRQFEAMRASLPATPADALTRDNLRAEHAGYGRRLQRERAQDVCYDLDQIAASSSLNGFGTQTVSNRLILSLTSGTGSVVGTGGTPTSNGNGAIERLFKLTSGSSFTFTADLDASSSSFPSVGQACPAVYDPAHVSFGAGGDISKVDLGFYYSDCGDGVVDSPEVCDAGVNNGTAGSCCTTSCTYRDERHGVHRRRRAPTTSATARRRSASTRTRRRARPASATAAASAPTPTPATARAAA